MTVEPDERPELTAGKWGRVNARACARLLDALDPTVKSDIIARKANQAASHILFRLYSRGHTAEPRSWPVSDPPQMVPESYRYPSPVVEG